MENCSAKKSSRPLTRKTEKDGRDGRIFQEKLNDVVRVLRDADKLVGHAFKLERMIALDLIGPLVEVMKVKYKNFEKGNSVSR